MIRRRSAMKKTWPLWLSLCVAACGSSDSGDEGASVRDAAGGGDATPDSAGQRDSSFSVPDSAAAAPDTSAPADDDSGPTGDAAGDQAAADSSTEPEAASSSEGGPTADAASEAGAPEAGTKSSCAAVPVTPNATQQAKNVLCYLYSQYGNHILSGQEEDAGGTAYDVEFDYIYKTTGKYPVIRSFDANNAEIPSRCLAQWQANGLCMLGYHMGAPDQPDGYTGAMYNHGGTTASNASFIENVLTTGTSNNKVFNQRLDNVVSQVQQVQAGNGVVIMRLFHEAGGTWFWWSMGGGSEYVKIWEYAFKYITGKGITAVLWLLPYDGSPDASFYPGSNRVDLAGADNYNSAYDYSPMTSLYDSTRTIAGTTLPIALHENGPMPDPDQLQSSKTNWIFFNTWTAPYPENDTSAAELQKIYSSSYVITRDKMPSLK
jgi:beta-mannanase